MSRKAYVFKGYVLDTEEGDTVTVKAYDVLSRLTREHIPINEGEYQGMDAGAIWRDIISNSGNDINALGSDLSTGVIIDSLDLTDMDRLSALRLILQMINGVLKSDVYHFYARDNNVILAPLPDYGDTVLELTDADKLSNCKRSKSGSNYYNCATCLGAGDIRGYFPNTMSERKVLIPNFPSSPRYHKIIKEYKDKLIGNAVCNYIARGFVRTHNTIHPSISVTFRPERFDYIQGQLVNIQSEKYDINGDFRIVDMSWRYTPKSWSMTMELSALDKETIADLIKKL